MVLVGFIALQGVRFIIPDFQLDNPPVTRTIDWDSPETEALWRRACADCHSNETVYPWYAYIAPMGWLVAHDTHEGREELNISEDSRIRSGELVEVIQKGEMPLPIYLPLHPEARLTDAEKAALIEGIRATFR
ncbi:MAG: heme-binding domain-containing protein [Chloroflexi bacterium]|nr:heme-binding domain-containing protein [Chloroflexota bacterium]